MISISVNTHTLRSLNIQKKYLNLSQIAFLASHLHHAHFASEQRRTKLEKQTKFLAKRKFACMNEQKMSEIHKGTINEKKETVKGGVTLRDDERKLQSCEKEYKRDELKSYENPMDRFRPNC